MKTLIVLLTASLLISTNSSAQFSENFDQSITALSSNCWVLNQINYSTTTADVINGTGSAYSNPPTSGSGERTIGTPFLNVTTTSLSVSFKYKTSSKIAGQATRTINIGLLDKNGVFTSLQVITMDKNTTTSVLTHNATYTIPTTGVFRLELRIGGATGDGNSRVIFDDLNVSASAYYGPTVHCNPAAIAVNDTDSIPTLAAVSNNVLLNDQFPADNEIYTATLITSPASGTLVFNADGSYTYTPAPTFTGGTISFTYSVGDNGYTPSTSNVATVTLNYAMLMMLPVRLLDFNAELSGKSVQLDWLVEDNHTGEYFVVEKSADGKTFVPVLKVAAVPDAIQKAYQALDTYNAANSYYRLKIVNNDQTVKYSKVILIRGGAGENEIQLKGNPVQSTLTLTYTAISERSTFISVYSMSGAKVHQSAKTTTTGANTICINMQNITPGMYVVMIDNADGRKTEKFVKK